MNGGIGCARGNLDIHSKGILLQSLMTIIRGNATFFELSEDTQKNLLWLADALASDVIDAIPVRC